jgi:transcriptional regulator with XRE-family HTH domain
MEKTIFSDGYRVFLDCLREARRGAGMTQEDLADRLGQTQSFVSKCERGERRIDVLELMAFCEALGADFVTFTSNLKEKLKRKR